MNTPRRPPPSSDSPNSGTDGWHPSLAYLLLALVLLAGGVAFLLWNSASSGETPDEPNIASAAAPATEQASKAENNWPPPLPVQAKPAADSILPEGDADPTRDLSSYLMRGEKPTMPEVIDRLHKAGIYTGLGAFSPPGTRPPMVGLAVPEDFVLPDGYVRHHQATDDGQRIEAILMFAPDRQFFDAANRPIPVPANRVVPAEYAPPGMPIRQIVIPAPINTANKAP